LCINGLLRTNMKKAQAVRIAELEGAK